MLKITKRDDSPYYQITGTLKGRRIRESAGTIDEETAHKLRIEIERKILYEVTGGRTVADAIEAYLDNGGEDRYLDKINEVMGPLALEAVTQETIDKCAREAYGTYKRGPKGKTYQHNSSTIKRQFYDPVAAVLHYAADMSWIPYRRVKKPKVTLPPPEWAEPDWFKKLWKNCDNDLKAITMFLAFTGSRIQDCLDLEWKNVDLRRQTAFIFMQKTKTSRTVRLPPQLVSILRLIQGDKTGRVFSAFKNYDAFRDSLRRACGVSKIPYKSSHKIGSHTYATWLRRYTGMDSRGLVDTGRWKSPQMAERYTHTDVSAESKKADVFGKLFK